MNEMQHTGAARRRITVEYDFPADFKGPACEVFAGTSQLLGRIACALHVGQPRAARELLDTVPELRMLTGGVNSTPEGAAQSGQGSLSERLFGQKHLEFDRTAVGIMVLNWLLEKNYADFTACQQEQVRLTPQSFAELSELAHRILQSDQDSDALLTYIVVSNTGKVRSEAWDAMLTYMAINDLTKCKEIVDEVKARWKIEHIDHDKALFAALSAHPEVSPSFSRLTPYFQGLILEGLSAEFNIGQLVQGECPPASLCKVGSISPRALHFYLLHALCDVAGARGHIRENGSLVMDEPTYQGFKAAVAALTEFDNGASVEQVYRRYLELRSRGWGFNAATPEGYALARLACMLRCTAGEAPELNSAFYRLPGITRTILTKELNVSGTGDGLAILPYYSPALFSNLRDAFANQPEGFGEVAALGMTTLARLFQEARTALRRRADNGVYTLYMRDVANAAKKPDSLRHGGFELTTVGQDAQVSLKPYPSIGLPDRIYAVRQVPLLADMGNFVAVGAGGGSDCQQAAAISKLIEAGGGKCLGVVSIGHRAVENGEMIAPDIYRIARDSRGRGTGVSGRFLEPLTANFYPTILINDDDGPGLPEKLRSAFRALGAADKVLALDTGGDALYAGMAGEDGKTTPDQDVRVLSSLAGLGLPVVAAVAACGVDSPPNAGDILKKLQAFYAELNPAEIEKVAAMYEQVGLDGTSDVHYGKTPYAWLAALRGQYGIQALPIPPHAVLDRRNPWNPYVYVQRTMGGIFFFELKDYLRL